MVYRLAEWINQEKRKDSSARPRKAPSAELRPNQVDQDSLPPYELLDAILERHIEQHQSGEEIVAQGFDEAIVQRVLERIKIAEFKTQAGGAWNQGHRLCVWHRLAHVHCASGMGEKSRPCKSSRIGGI